MPLDSSPARRVTSVLVRLAVGRLPAAILLGLLVGAIAGRPASRAAAVGGRIDGFPRAVASRPGPAAARALFDRLRGLAGEWHAVSDRGWSEVVTYEVIARGSVVMSTTAFRDAPDRKMVTMYYMDDDRLVATHYCEARNQPRLVADEVDPAVGRAVFRFAGGGNLADRDRGHMDRTVIRILDDDHVVSRWTWYQDGSEEWLEEIELVRVRDDSTAPPQEPSPGPRAGVASDPEGEAGRRR